MRRKFLKKLALGAGFIGISQSTFGAVQKPAKADFLHIVFIWLKNPTELDAAIADTKAFLKNVPVVVSYHVGVPSSTNRPIVDRSYSYCLTVGFEDLAGHDVYQKHEAHLDFLSKWKERTEKILIYDPVRP